MKQAIVFFLFFLGLQITQSHAQTDAGKTVDIITADRFYFSNPDANTSIQRLAGNVQLRQGNSLFYCDSCVINNTTKIFEAFGKVHINDNDTTNIYSDYLRYVSDTRMAYLSRNVRLTDGKATLTTNDLEYDMGRNIGTYRNGGRVVNKKSVLTSVEGVYYTDVRDIYFRQNVRLKDPAYTLTTDSLLYNTETQIARFIAETLIVDSSKRTIRTREGFYDVANRKAEFTSRTFIQDGALRITGDRIASDDASGNTQIEGRGVLIDTAQGINILADRIFANKEKAAYLATQKPLMIIRQDNDSIYIAADTLFSARLSDLYKAVDSNKKAAVKQSGTVQNKKDSTATPFAGIKRQTDSLQQKTAVNVARPQQDSIRRQRVSLSEKDSTNRYFEAYRNVRIFSDSLQSVCDSMFYTFKDSTFELYQNPVLWSRKSQITGDTIYLFTKNKKADYMKVFLSSFMINEVEPGVYNQIKSVRIDGFFKEGKMDSIRAWGEAESIYFIQDNDSAYTSVNQTKSDIIDGRFENGELEKVIFRRDLKGTVFPIAQKRPGEARLTGFRWLENRRPKTKYELFE